MRLEVHVSRTAHHRSSLHRWSTDGRLVLEDLRYSAACLQEAVHQCRRPHPARLRHDVRMYRRAGVDARLVAGLARTTERRHRRLARGAADHVRRLVNPPAGGPLRMQWADAVDQPAARHRHDALWHGW